MCWSMMFVDVSQRGPDHMRVGPTKWVIAVGEAIPLDGLEAAALDDELLLSRLTEELRARIQELVSQALERRASVWG